MMHLKFRFSEATLFQKRTTFAVRGNTTHQACIDACQAQHWPDTLTYGAAWQKSSAQEHRATARDRHLK
eukprot:2814081-Rhodomonas_salina.1